MKFDVICQFNFLGSNTKRNRNEIENFYHLINPIVLQKLISTLLSSRKIILFKEHVNRIINLLLYQIKVKNCGRRILFA